MQSQGIHFIDITMSPLRVTIRFQTLISHRLSPVISEASEMENAFKCFRFHPYQPRALRFHSAGDSHSPDDSNSNTW